MAADTTAPSYWLNWRFLLCGLLVLVSMIVAAILITKYEVFNKQRRRRRDDMLNEDPVGILYEDETWRTSMKAINPAWLLAFRLFAFALLFAMLIANVVLDGANIVFFYTQWTFALVTFYFGLASSLSIYGCWQCWNEVRDDNINHVGLDAERGTYIAPPVEENSSSHDVPINPNNYGETHIHKTAGLWGYLFQIVFQICAGAVGLTDTVFWFIIYPYLLPATHKLNLLEVGMHSINAVLLLVDVFLNRLRFPFFRLAYFILWTCIFVIFQWIVHACVPMWWPYAFLDLSSPYAPIWYLGVGLIHLPTYGVFALIVKGKESCLSRR